MPAFSLLRRSPLPATLSADKGEAYETHAAFWVPFVVMVR
jgi:hypothetical protein